MASVVLVSAFALRPPPRVTPVEDRPAFLQALSDLDADQPAAALGHLALLGTEAQLSLFTLLFSAAAHARLGHPEETDKALEGAWSAPGAEALLTSWGRDHPALTVHAVNLAGNALSCASAIDAVRKPGFLDRVEKTFRLVLRLDPRNPRAVEALAVIDEARHRYASAHAGLSTLIATNGTPEPTQTKPRQRLMTLLKTRARISTHWAESLGDDPGTDVEQNAYFSRAVGDLDAGVKLFQPGDERIRFELWFIRCDTTLARAEAARRRGRLDEAAGLYRVAKLQLKALAAGYPPDQEAAFKALEKKVKEWGGAPSLKALDLEAIPHTGD